MVKQAGWESAVAGGLGAAFSRTCIAPLERLRMQMIADPGKYSGMHECITTIWKTEGIRGLWRGNSINVYRIAPQSGIGFFCKDFYKVKFGQTPLGRNGKPTVLSLAVSSATSGITMMTLTYPLDLVRTRMTTTPGVYKGMIDGFQQIAKKEGVLALFTKGLTAANMFAVPYYGTSFFALDMMKRYYATFGRRPGNERALNPLISLPMGAIANMMGCAVAFPFQTAWKRIQVQGLGGRPILYTGPLMCIRTIVRDEGFFGLFNGLRANLVKLIPTGAIQFGAVDQIKIWMGLSIKG
mmetsp:Transcript_16662/g.29891  ORF Transcript_16662/g.29891 Transcript_16662/m.29891 type:complete len:296 (+) Transcript_16662:132-1019(+)|eukprot:CAMPEP_0197523724 /NCGR_PEP_ID=MMETSP1318-20131121/8598_1 /TAXON_ID=552666 /ORGANISM="Partenskyella glossopodia, Strain RCC365" /LENGTH=295 /DNA_ID=CAMNT_0043076513 /DNA_START=103 /DNA_END=990 /DNA_ORIENTATION=-